MPGPAPKHPSRRSRASSANIVQLPAAGFSGPVPPWPLSPDLSSQATLDHMQDKVASLQARLEAETDGRVRGGIRRQLNKVELAEALARSQVEGVAAAEAGLWAELWRDPQAVMWEKSTAFQRSVAQFVRWNIRAEQGDLKAATEARLRGDSLGLTPRSLLALRREIAEADAAEDRADERRRRRNESARKPDRGDPRAGLFAV